MTEDRGIEQQSRDWVVEAREPSIALVETELRLRAEALAERGYQYVAQLGHRPRERIEYHPREISISGGCLNRIGCGFQGVLYRYGSLVFKVNHNLSFGCERELRNYRQALTRLGRSHPELIICQEINYGLATFPDTTPPVQAFRQDLQHGRYFPTQHVLVKDYLEGLTVRQLVEQKKGVLLDEEWLRQLGQLFRSCAETGILLQGDPDDFLFEYTPASRQNQWTALDPDGWVTYPKADPHVLLAARGAFIGTFRRLLAEIEEKLRGRPMVFLRDVISLTEQIAVDIWGEVDVSTFDPEAFRSHIAEDDPLSPEDPVLEALIRTQWKGPLLLDFELGRCSLNVMITTKALLGELFELRGFDPKTEDLSNLYFGDLGVLWGRQYVAIHNSYNDNQNPRSGDWAYNHTGITNWEIAELARTAAESRL